MTPRHPGARLLQNKQDGWQHGYAQGSMLPLLVDNAPFQAHDSGLVWGLCFGGQVFLKNFHKTLALFVYFTELG